MIASQPSLTGAEAWLDPGPEIYRSEEAFHPREDGPWALLPAASDARIVSVVGENYQLRALQHSGGDIVVVWLPQLEGTSEAAELLLRLAAARGMAALALVPPANADLTGVSHGGRDDAMSERMRAGRAAVRLVGDVPSRCVAVIGLSLGGHAAVLVAQLESSVDVLVAMLAGSGESLTGSVDPLSQPAAESLRDSGGARLRSLLNRSRLAPKDILMVSALFDQVIPARATHALSETLGHPRSHAYPSGHESFRVFLPLAMWRALGFVERACEPSLEGG